MYTVEPPFRTPLGPEQLIINQLKQMPLNFALILPHDPIM